MNNGYIKIYRKILENPIVTKDNDYFRVWIYLLLNATHKKKKVIFGNSVIELNIGELITGREKIANECNISESKAERILKVLKIEQQIEQQTTSKGRLIKIVNWEEYQETEQQIEQQVNNKWTTSEQQVNTNNNNKNVINNKKENTKRKKFDKPTIEEINNYCLERNNGIDATKFYDFYESKDWYIGKNKMKDWKACVRTWESKETKKAQVPNWLNKNFNEEKERTLTKEDYERIRKIKEADRRKKTIEDNNV